MKRCICGNKRSFKGCCEPFLQGKSRPRTATQLMRSRYTAYVLGGYAEYLLNTWHPNTVGTLTRAELTPSKYAWKGLEIVESQQTKDTAKVEFKATYTENSGPNQVHHETSAFTRVKGQWLYLSGDIY